MAFPFPLGNVTGCVMNKGRNWPIGQFIIGPDGKSKAGDRNYRQQFMPKMARFEAVMTLSILSAQ